MPRAWMANWSDLVDFEVHAVVASAEAACKIAAAIIRQRWHFGGAAIVLCRLPALREGGRLEKPSASRHGAGWKGASFDAIAELAEFLDHSGGARPPRFGADRGPAFPILRSPTQEEPN
jgi:hypothetical protein